MLFKVMSATGQILAEATFEDTAERRWIHWDPADICIIDAVEVYGHGSRLAEIQIGNNLLRSEKSSWFQPIALRPGIRVMVVTEGPVDYLAIRVAMSPDAHWR